MMYRKTKIVVVAMLIFTLLGGCQSQLKLMPTPEVLKDPQFDVFAEHPHPEKINQIEAYYVTTRSLATSGPSFYTGTPDELVHYGRALLQIGKPEQNVLEHLQATTQSSKDSFSWELIDALEIASRPRSFDSIESGCMDPDPETLKFIDSFNTTLVDYPIKDLTIYVHGAKNTFYWSVAQGAQYQFFTGNNAMVLTFSWPSPGSIWGYQTDKAQADAAADDLACLIELLAAHSEFHRLHLIAYSAGGRVAGGALSILGARDYTAADLRIGQVYLTSSDEPLARFIDNLPLFYDLVEGLTLTMAEDDMVLALARLTDKKERLGAPSTAPNEELGLDKEAEAELRRMINSDRISLIDLGSSDIEGFRFSHGAWYENSWVSTDVMVTLLTGWLPNKRGLTESVSADGYQFWYFPKTYLDDLKAALIENPE